MDSLTEHYVSQINRAIASGREDLIDELTAQHDVETRSTSLRALLKRADRHRR
ncbi:hypothetical protein [Cryptosporangium phraense]|uniref:hypothetical protein n=1 Tax=Cryptosporangium phraense TaxID=2593070 RepID=UPI0014793FD3|nr:hypothetical protein [Cryptosporangium phraense]